MLLTGSGMYRMQAGLVEPALTDVPPPDAPIPSLDNHELMRIRAAAIHAKRLYPGPVGELIHRELTTWAEFGHRFAEHGLVRRLVDHVMTTPLP